MRVSMNSCVERMRFDDSRAYQALVQLRIEMRRPYQLNRPTTIAASTPHAAGQARQRKRPGVLSSNGRPENSEKNVLAHCQRNLGKAVKKRGHGNKNLENPLNLDRLGLVF
jgi:hypothetical protein